VIRSGVIVSDKEVMVDGEEDIMQHGHEVGLV